MTERQHYEVLAEHPGFELRRYSAHLVAEVELDSSFADAGNQAFGILVAFISGRNSASGKIAMTAPVVQQPASAKIAMTSPVIQQPGAGDGRQLVGFVMPATFSVDTLPVPTDPRIRIREVPAQRAVASSFSGRWSEAIYRDELARLTRLAAEARLEVVGPPRFARFDPPWTPWFLRHNEVVLPVADAHAGAAA